MITIYPANAEDFSTLGLGTLDPTKCEIEEKAGGMYELVLRHPITDDQRAFMLATDRIIKVNAPIRETPEVTIGNKGTTTVQRDIWRVKTSSGRLHLRSKPNGHVIGAYPSGTRVVKYGESSVPKWWGVILCDGGAKGYMYSDYLEHVGLENETIVDDAPGEVIKPRQTREQLFRIYSVTNDSAGRFVEARARHISYDLGSAIVTGEYAPENVSAATVCSELLARADHDTGINIICGITDAITGDFTGKNILEALLEPEVGVAALTGAKVIRDNFDIFLIPDEPRRRDAEIRYGKNLLTASLMQDAADVITRIYPVGRDEEGEDLVADPVESAHIGDYPVVRTARVEYDVVVGDDMTREQALAKLREMAQADFDAGVDLPTAKLDTDFVRLELAPQYAELANQYAFHLYDSVPVIDRGAGIDATVRMVGYKFDVLLSRYSKTTLGDITEISTPIYGYELAGGSVSGSKIARNSVGGANLREASIGMAHIRTATIEQLSANAVTAVRADIRKLVAGEITTDQLYADLAAIAAAQITAANIEKANIDWAQIDTLLASIAEIARAEIGTADIDYAKIKDMITNTAIITEGVGGQLYINRLAVTDANMVSLTTGELLLKNASGDFVRLTVDDAGNVTGTVVQVEGENIAENTVSGGNLIENTITARELNVASIFADSALIRAIKAANIDVADLFAADATIDALDNYILRTETIEALEGKLNVWAQEKIDLAVGNVQIGGTNLLINSSLYRADNPITATSNSTDYFAPNREMYMLCTPGETYTFQAVTDGIWGNHASNVSSTPVTHLFLYLQTADIPFENPGSYSKAVSINAGAYLGQTGRGVWTYTIPTDKQYVRLRIRYDIHSDGSAPVTVSWWDFKAERGNKATDWSPPVGEDYAKGVIDGSALSITRDSVQIVTPVFGVNVSGTNGDMSISETGLSINTINSPSVHRRYNGPTTLTVGGTADGVSTFATLGDAFAKLSGCFLPEPVAINIAISALTENRAVLRNAIGSAVTVNGGGCTITGQIYLDSLQSRVELDNMTIQSGGDHAAVVYDCVFMRASGCTFVTSRAAGTYYMGVDCDRSTLDLSGCSFRNCYAAISALHNSYVSIYNCTGNANAYSVQAKYNTRVGMLIARPAAEHGLIIDASCCISADPGAGTSGSSSTPAATTTVTLTATNTRTHAGSWYSGTNVLSQGVSGGTSFYGYMWFDLGTISGKTIKSASIRLYRRAGVGRGVPVEVYVGTHNAAGPSGGLSMVNAYADHLVGKVDQKEMLSASVATAAVQALASGTAKGLFMHSGSSGYAQFDGFDGSVPPQLTVTYQ